MMRKLSALFVSVAFVVTLVVVSDVATISEAFAQVLPGGTSSTGANIRATRHNLSPTSAPTRQDTSGNTTTTEAILTSTSTSEICVYCHTPHGALQDAQAPLWNRQHSTETYTPYSSSSLNASDLDLANLATPSKLCLSCHDGSIAVGAVSNAPGSGLGSGTPKITVSNTASGGAMPFGRGQANADHGFTRRLGNDLRNDHPIAFTYDTALASADGELRNPSGSASPTLIANRVLGSPKPNFPLAGNQVQCSTCHDPHRNTQKFLLKNRLAQAPAAPINAPQVRQSSWTNWDFNDTYDQICLGCHTRLGKAWGVSAHSSSVSADEAYVAGDAAVRDFPTGTKVWQAGCLNCHDTHTVAGSRRLLREGVDSGTSAVSLGYTANIRSGVPSGSDYNATSALENTCYQCHSSSPIITPTTLTASEGVPNIQAEFNRTYRMPIKNGDQGDPFFGNSFEVHDISDADGVESQTNMGYFAPENRHAECTDCHNPHRVVKADTFLGANLSGADLTRRTHVPARGTTGNEGNIASGALRGIWGVEPSYTALGQTTVTVSGTGASVSGTIWPENPTYTVKKGDPGAETVLPVGTAGTNAAPYVTREYQLCFKCHSSYANGPLKTDFPDLKPAGNLRGGSPTGSNNMLRYTNVAAEFAARATDPPSTGMDQGEASANNIGNACIGGTDCVPVGSFPRDLKSNGAADPATGDINHRSWHPVVFPTGRTKVERGSASFNNIRPPFDTKVGTQTMHCSDCHGNRASYTAGTGPDLTQVQGPHGSDNVFILKGTYDSNTSLSNYDDGTRLCGNCHQPRVTGIVSGFAGNHQPDGNMAGLRCQACHITVPHGWKNKAFLVNRNCVGTEGGQAGNCSGVADYAAPGFSAAPYYFHAYNAVTTWMRSGLWTAEADCQPSTGAGSTAMKDCGKN